MLSHKKYTQSVSLSSSNSSIISLLFPLSVIEHPIDIILNFFFVKVFTLKYNSNADVRLVSRQHRKKTPYSPQDLPLSLCGHRNPIKSLGLLSRHDEEKQNKMKKNTHTTREHLTALWKVLCYSIELSLPNSLTCNIFGTFFHLLNLLKRFIFIFSFLFQLTV